MSARLTLGVTALALCTLAPTAPADPPDGSRPARPSLRRPGDGDDIKLAALDEAFKKRVAVAVSKGQEFLLKRARPDGRWPTKHDLTHIHKPFNNGGTALVVLTLIKCGVNPSRVEISRAFAYLKESWDAFNGGGRQPGAKAWKTYEAACTLMALEALDNWRPGALQRGKTQPVGVQLKKQGFRDWAKQLRDFLVANQVAAREIAPNAGARGGDTKGGSRSSGGKPVRPKEAWSYPLTQALQSDHSNTQYAILGLRSAAHLGFPPPPEVWQGVVYHFLDMQETTGPEVKRKVLDLKKIREKGVTRTRHRIVTEAHVIDHARGWGYPGGNMPVPTGGQHGTTGSMTTVGIASLAIAWHELRLMAYGDRKRRVAPDPKLRRWLAKSSLGRMVEQAKWDGFAWLSHHWSVTENPQLPEWHYYYLYGLERAGVLTGTDTIGGHDWYREGGDVLLNAQHGDGGWDSGKNDGLIPSTCFALLFLKRATVPLVATTK